jgi:hypothetical protein
VKIDTFVTCGSPLGIPVIMNKIRAEMKIKDRHKPLPVPQNIERHWYNLSDLQDRVALNCKLGDEFVANAKGVVVEDIQVINTYEYHGEKNPHKDYGYLRTPEMAEILYAFQRRDEWRLKIWLLEKLYQMVHRKEAI